MNLKIRQENEKDRDAIYALVKSAFEHAEHASHDEQNLVDRLRKIDAYIPALALVAEIDGKIVGHILFTKIKIGIHDSITLAPVSVLPEYQRQGIGSQLILEAHKRARELGYRSSIVVGHPTYYPRFGYKKASEFGINASFEVPDECLMAIELVNDGLKGITGTIVYPKEFFEK